MSEDKQKENPTPITSDEKKPDEKKPATELTEKDLKGSAVESI